MLRQLQQTPYDRTYPEILVSADYEHSVWHYNHILLGFSTAVHLPYRGQRPPYYRHPDVNTDLLILYVYHLEKNLCLYRT